MFDLGNATCSIIDLNTGEKLIEVEAIPPSAFEYHMSTNQQSSFTLTMEDVNISPEVMRRFLGEQTPISKYNIEAVGKRKKLVQAKMHKKKRINKKWLKKYGYKEIDVPIHIKMDDCTISKDNLSSDVYSINGSWKI